MEEANTSPNRMILVLLGVIVLLLAAIAAYFVFAKGSDEAVGATEPPAAQPAMGAPAVFDPATATRVGEGVAPVDHVTVYFDAVVTGDYAAAYDMLPADKKASQSVEEFSKQLQGYGMNSYTIDSAVEEGDRAEVMATASMSGGEFQYLWTFVKDGSGWLVQSRTLPGMGQ